MTRNVRYQINKLKQKKHTPSQIQLKKITKTKSNVWFSIWPFFPVAVFILRFHQITLLLMHVVYRILLEHFILQAVYGV